MTLSRVPLAEKKKKKAKFRKVLGKNEDIESLSIPLYRVLYRKNDHAINAHNPYLLKTKQTVEWNDIN